jgi:hypothetical protein
MLKARLSAVQQRVLSGMKMGMILKDHRDIDGNKFYRLYMSNDDSWDYVDVDANDVHALIDLGVISSNKKFPSATYWLTDQKEAKN